MEFAANGQVGVKGSSNSKGAEKKIIKVCLQVFYFKIDRK